MSPASHPARRPHALTRLLDRIGVILLTVAVGVVLGLQYNTPNKRVLSVITALLMFGLTWRLDIITGLGVMAVALPFPRATVVFNTNVFLIALMLVIWLLRVSMRQCAPPHRSPIDAPLVALFIFYVLSFYNVQGRDLTVSLARFGMMTATWLVFYLVASIPQTRRDFRRLLGFQAFSVLLVCLAGIFELTHPGQSLIPGWIEFANIGSPGTVAFGIRVGSVFYDYELLCEYCAIQAVLILFLFVRAETLLLRTFYGGLLTLVMFMLFTTVTRGGIISLGIGVLYLLVLVRRRLTMVGVTITAVVVAAALTSMNWFVAVYTHTGDMFARLGGSRMTGFMPDNRSIVWPQAWNRIFEHPFLGHGPYYSSLSGPRTYFWPHSLYLYVANNIGFIGFAVFAWLLWILFRITRPMTDDLRHADYLQGYMLIARTQMIVFLVDETKIEYLRNDIYSFQVWMLFGMMVAAHRVLASGAASADARRNVLVGAVPPPRSPAEHALPSTG
jgi:O-antigen ligase